MTERSAAQSLAALAATAFLVVGLRLGMAVAGVVASDPLRAGPAAGRQ